MADVPTYRPDSLSRPEQTTALSTGTFSAPEYQLDANHERAKQMFAQRQAQQPELGELHRMALEAARSEQEQPQRDQAQAVRELAGQPRDQMYPESGVRAGIETAARSGFARGYQLGHGVGHGVGYDLGRQHEAAGTPTPDDVVQEYRDAANRAGQMSVGRVFGGRDVGEKRDQPGYGGAVMAGITGPVFNGADVHQNMTDLALLPITSDSGSLLDADLAAMPGGDEHAQVVYDLAHAHATSAASVRSARTQYPFVTRISDAGDALTGMGVRAGRAAAYGVYAHLNRMGQGGIKFGDVDPPEATGKAARDWLRPY